MGDVACLPLARQLSFTPMSEDEEELTLSSPHHTRSGRVYTGGNSSRRRRGKRKSVREAEGDVADCEEEEVEHEEERLPAVSRCLKTSYRATIQVPSSPINRSDYTATSPIQPTSPPCTNLQVSPYLSRSHAYPISSPTTDSLRVPGTMVFDHPGSKAPTMSRLSLLESPNTSSVRTPKSTARGRMRSKLLFTFRDDNRPTLCASPLKGDEEPANINPFTPAPSVLRARARESSQSDFSDCPFEGGDSSQEKQPKTKKVRVSDMNVTRYQDEFLELSRVASGTFGSVVKARHRLDGVVYAVKITKKKPKRNSRDEKVALNEVFVLAAMMKHRHVVRYFNAWVESGRLHIQTEFCEGGSLEAKVNVCIESNMKFSDIELRKILIQVARGLQYLHKKKLAHLDIKPANILIAFCEPEEILASPVASGKHNPFRTSPDSGAVSQGDGPHGQAETAFYGPTPDTVRYKIGDLGHAMAWNKEEACGEEGDCRYMAPEFLKMGGVSGPQLAKADVFSLGLSVYEAARLRRLPKNADEGADFPSIRKGLLSTVPRLPKDLMLLLRTLTQTESSNRPTADRLLKHAALDASAMKTYSQLKKELKEEKAKVYILETKLNGTLVPSTTGRTIGRGTSRSASTIF